MMCFRTVEDVDLTVNPSYMSFIVEDVVEIIDVTMEENKLIKQEKLYGKTNEQRP